MESLFAGTNRPLLHIQKTAINEAYSVTENVLGLGINGKVVECIHRKTGRKYALKVSLRFGQLHVGYFKLRFLVERAMLGKIKS
jgi:hypothetical protein